jgi:hypothetical protein
MIRLYGVNQFKFDGIGDAFTVAPGSQFDSDSDAALRLIEDLRAHDAHLRELYNWYRHHSGRIQTVSYFETRDTLGARIVNETSANAGIGADPVGLDEDHLSIAKPRQQDAQVCGAARDLLRVHKSSAWGGTPGLGASYPHIHS